jgi:hypothetical protein
MSDDAKQRFRDFVALSLTPSRLLYEEQERDLIGEGIAKFKLPGEAARGVLAVVAEGASQIREREVARSMLAVLRGVAGRRNAIDKRRFALGVTILQAITDGEFTEAEARAWLKRLIERNDFRIRGSGLLRRKRWFRRIKPVA